MVYVSHLVIQREKNYNQFNFSRICPLYQCYSHFVCVILILSSLSMSEVIHAPYRYSTVPSCLAMSPLTYADIYWKMWLTKVSGPMVFELVRLLLMELLGRELKGDENLYTLRFVYLSSSCSLLFQSCKIPAFDRLSPTLRPHHRRVSLH